MNLKEQLIEKTEAEFEHFHSWLLEQPPEEIWISHTITSRSRIF